MQNIAKGSINCGIIPVKLKCAMAHWDKQFGFSRSLSEVCA